MSDLKIFTDNIEPEALSQIYTLVKQPVFADCKVRIMPDVHAGAGCVIGFTADLGDKVIPNIVSISPLAERCARASMFVSICWTSFATTVT